MGFLSFFIFFFLCRVLLTSFDLTEMTFPSLSHFYFFHIMFFSSPDFIVRLLFTFLIHVFQYFV